MTTKNKLFVLIHLLLGISSSLTAQSPAAEIKIAYGYWTGAEHGFNYKDIIATPLSNPINIKIGDVKTGIINGIPQYSVVSNVQNDMGRSNGSLIVGYSKFIGRHLSWGVQAGYTHFTYSSNVSYADKTTEVVFVKSDFIQVFGRLDFHFLMLSKFQLYSGIMVGGLHLIDDKTASIKFVPHINALGMRFGRQSAFYLEAGYGLSSFGVAGFSRQF